MKRDIQLHWPEYLIEATGLGLFMISACLFTALLHHPSSLVVKMLPDETARRALTGIAMGLTGICLTYSTFGRRSGAHFNPAVTLTFFRLGRVAPSNAAFYITAQFIGGALGVCIAAALIPMLIGHPSVDYAVTRPGMWGIWPAFVAECCITFALMSVVLRVSNTAKIARFTGLCAGALVALYITFESPISGMSMNPARTLASALSAHDWTALWIYFTAPILGMLAAAEVYVRFHGSVFCAKLMHDSSHPCIFCTYRAQSEDGDIVPVEFAGQIAGR